MAADPNGNLFIADTYGDRIRKVDTNGLITTVAGNGTNGYSGDGGMDANVELHYPFGVAVDAADNRFIADMSNQRIRKVDANGLITTVAGNGAWGYSGDGGAAPNASLANPSGVAVAVDGNLLIADEENQRIRKVVFQVPTLTLAGVTAAKAGNYQVIVTNPRGSVTSRIVNVTVSPPQITATPNPNGSVTLNLWTAPNVSSTVLAATNLTPPVVWQSLCSFVPGTNGVWQFTVSGTGGTSYASGLVLII